MCVFTALLQTYGFIPIFSQARARTRARTRAQLGKTSLYIAIVTQIHEFLQVVPDSFACPILFLALALAQFFFL